MNELVHPPAGTVTFLLTDLEGSTRMWEHDPDAMKAAMARHDYLLEEAIAANQGFVFARMGDGMAAAFNMANDAIAAAGEIQRALADEPWGTASPLRARIGLHTGEGVVVEGSGYASRPVNHCSRLMAAAHGGQVIVSGSTEALVRDELPDAMGLMDLGEHRLRDLGRPTRVFQLTSAGCREEFPPLRSLDAYPGNLPVQVSSFIGREADVARVAAALSDWRVVTITGTGGVGKTRLAIQVAADLLPRYREGAWLAELGPVRDPDDVVGAAAAAFHLTSRAGPSLEDSLIEMLGSKKLLLVLDNCEHVLGPVARLVTRIERECPDVTVLATSREGLAVEGEQLIGLPPLEVGEPGDDTARLAQTDAVSLFVERARNIKADFALTDGNVEAVVEICRRLDGVPLAIELAAARVIALSPAELLRRLDRRFRVLAGGRRGAVGRHATLRAAIDWSYELLQPDEQRLLARMAVFSGGCTLEAVEQVCSDEPVDRDSVLDLITNLVSRSLVIAEDHGAGTRYRLLETIRQYGEERLAECGETETLVLRHASFYADLLARAADYLYGPEQASWARRVSAERDNIRAALTAAIDTGEATLAVRLVANHPDGSSQDASHVGEAFSLPASRVLDMAGVSREPGYPKILTVAAAQAFHSGDRDKADDLCRQALEADRALSSALPGGRIEINVRALQALNSLSTGAYDEAVTIYRRAAELARADGYLGLAAIFLGYGANSALLGGDVEQAIALAEEAVTDARKSEVPTAMASTANALALALVDHDPPRARALLQESIDRSLTPGEEMTTAVLMAGLAAARLQDWNLTLALTARSLHLWRWVDSPLEAGPCLALCARALAGERPEIAGVLRGAAYAAFHRASISDASDRSASAPVDSNVNFVLAALRETGDTVANALGAERRQELRVAGAAMTMDEAISYALASVDPKLLTGPITVGAEPISDAQRGERKRPPNGWESLTPAELDVVRLVGEGLANKDIATRLVVSPRTVETHLGHVYTKLGLASRVQLAQEAARHA
jgi:predicted ATPase/class 3 adenylate cyclase/DNA-binding CsgD family transcriptional regulator